MRNAPSSNEKLLHKEPEHSNWRDIFEGIAKDVQSSEGTALILQAADDEATNFSALFERNDDYAD